MSTRCPQKIFTRLLFFIAKINYALPSAHSMPRCIPGGSDRMPRFRSWPLFHLKVTSDFFLNFQRKNGG
uniref:Putative secreted protein n=1 Tax=Ixodes ricinus TaxID=34613 RepID=A0A6B0U1P1_IXORI